MTQGAATIAPSPEAVGARSESQGKQLGAMAEAQLSGAMRLVSADASTSIARFCEPALLAAGKVNVVSLEAVQQRFGERWHSRKDPVFTFSDRVLERSLGTNGAYVRVSDTDFLVVHPDLSRLAGQAACLGYLREILTHFLGDADQAPRGVLHVSKFANGRLVVEEVDALGAEAAVTAGTAEDEDEPGRLGAYDDGGDLTTRAVNQWSPFVAVDGRRLRVSATLEPVYELKNFSRIGFRMIRRVIVIATSEELSAQQVAGLSAADILRADLATITRGIDRLKAEAHGERQLSLVVPMSFSSLSSQRGRAELIAPLKEAGSLVRLGVVCEILEVEGVPASALLAATSLVRPFSLLVVGRMTGSSADAMNRLKGGGLQAVSVECPLGLGDAEFTSWATTAIAAAKRVARSVLVYRVSPQRAGALAALGATHVSLTSS